MAYTGMTAEMVQFQGHNGDTAEGYYARPSGDGPFPGVVVIHHMPGWDEWSLEVARKFAHHGYAAIAPNLYFRAGEGAPDDVAARVRAEGGVADEQVMNDLSGAADFLRAQPHANGKVGVIGFCSGGRQAYLATALVPNIDAAVDCWGGGVIVDDPSQLSERRPVAPIDYTERMHVPLLGIFGNDDRSPTPEQVDRTEARLKELGKPYEFHRYDGAGHGFFAVDRPGYRPEQAVDGWNKVFDFFGRYLSAQVPAGAR